MSQRDASLSELEQRITNLELSKAEILPGKTYVCVVLSGDLKDITVPLKDTVIRQLEKLTQPVVALSFVNVNLINDSNLEGEAAGFLMLVNSLHGLKKQITLIRCPLPFQEYLKEKLTVPLTFSENLSGLFRKPTAKIPEFPHELETVSSATVTVFQKQFGIEINLRAGATPELRGAGSQIQAQVIGAIEVSSTHMVGQIILAMPNATVSNLCEHSLGTSLSPDDPDFAQIVGEISNLILGYTKDILNKEGYGIIQAIPKCFSGVKEASGLATLYVHNVSWIMKFGTPKGDFDVHVHLKRVGG